MNTSKIIIGTVGSGRYTVTAPIVKEDYGLYLQIEGVELPETYQVDFSNDEHSGSSVTMIGNSDGVLIPRQFIDSGKDVFAFLYHVGADFGRTVYKFRIPNKVRPDRTDEQPTPEEQSTIDQAISALNEAVAQTAQDVLDADASAQSASADAERAEEARTDAQNYATQAEQSATDAHESASQASASATASANSASQSAQIKTNVESMVDDAQGYAQASAQSASASATSATQAQGYAQSASASAQSASGYASSAQASANTASAKAQDASTSAQTASQKATESAQSATNASQSAQTAEQAKTNAQTAQGLAESARDSAISAKTDAESAKADAESARDEAVQAVESISGALDDKADVITDTASGAIASFTDGADDLPLKSLVVNIDPVQDLSNGDPSPENICPISGWEGMTVNASGKNLLDETKLNDAHLINCFIDDASHPQQRKGIAIYLPSGTYTFTCWKSVATAYLYYNVVKNDGTFVKFGFLATGTDYTTAKITLSDDEHILFFDQQASKESTQTKFGNYNIQLELGSTATDYEPYNGTTLSISWQTEAGTVYGGKLDVLSGILTVYPEYDSYNGESLTGEWISDRDVYAVGTTPTIGAQVVNIGAQGTEYQLEPHEIASLLGQNNIFADTGECSVEYIADTKLYINKKIAEALASLT